LARSLAPHRSRRRTPTRRSGWCALSFALALLAGCTHVAPYEREYLARPSIDTEKREALRSKFYAHVYDAREAAMGGAEHAGGGCGCN